MCDVFHGAIVMKLTFIVTSYKLLKITKNATNVK